MTAPPDPMANQSAPAVSTTDLPQGAWLTMEVQDYATEVQSRIFGTTDLATWPDGNPKMSVVVPVIHKGERHSLWIERSTQKFNAFKDANNKALEGLPQGSRIAPGWKIAMRVIGTEPSKVPSGSPKKLYEFLMKPGTVAPSDPFGGQPQQQPAPQQQQQQPQQQPQQTWAPPQQPAQQPAPQQPAQPQPTQNWGPPPTTDPFGGTAAPQSDIPPF